MEKKTVSQLDQELDFFCQCGEIDALRDAKRNQAEGNPLRAHMWRAIAARYRGGAAYSPFMQRNIYGDNDEYRACERAVAVADHYCEKLEGWPREGFNNG